MKKCCLKNRKDYYNHKGIYNMPKGLQDICTKCNTLLVPIKKRKLHDFSYYVQENGTMNIYQNRPDALVCSVEGCAKRNEKYLQNLVKNILIELDLI